MAIARRMLSPGKVETRQSILPEARKMFESRGVMVSEQRGTPGKSWSQFYQMTRDLRPGRNERVQDSFVIGSFPGFSLHFHEQGLVEDVSNQARFLAKKDTRDEVVADLFHTSICLAKDSPEHLKFFVESFMEHEHRYERFASVSGRYVATILFTDRMEEAVDIGFALSCLVDSIASGGYRRAYEAEQAANYLERIMEQFQEGNRFLDTTAAYLCAKVEELRHICQEARRSLQDDPNVLRLVRFIVKREDSAAGEAAAE